MELVEDSSITPTYSILMSALNPFCTRRQPIIYSGAWFFVAARNNRRAALVRINSFKPTFSSLSMPTASARRVRFCGKVFA